MHIGPMPGRRYGGVSRCPMWAVVRPFGQYQRLWVGHHVARPAAAGDGRGSGAVDHRLYSAGSVEKHREHVVESYGRSLRGLERHRVLNGDTLVEEGVTAHGVTLEAVDVVRQQERREAVLVAVGHPDRLAGHLVGILVLEEQHEPVLSAPDRLVLLVVLNEQPVGTHVVRVDPHTGRALVGRPHAGTRTVI